MTVAIGSGHVERHMGWNGYSEDVPRVGASETHRYQFAHCLGTSATRWLQAKGWIGHENLLPLGAFTFGMITVISRGVGPRHPCPSLIPPSRHRVAALVGWRG